MGAVVDGAVDIQPCGGVGDVLEGAVVEEEAAIGEVGADEAVGFGTGVENHETFGFFHVEVDNLLARGEKERKKGEYIGQSFHLLGSFFMMLVFLFASLART